MPNIKGYTSIEKKVWGDTKCVCSTDAFSVHHLNINKGGFCSEHKHLYKTNIFHIIHGKLSITIYSEGNLTESAVTIHTGQSMSVEPNVYHKFEALENTECLEIYKPQELSEDIQRRTVGGKE